MESNSVDLRKNKEFETIYKLLDRHSKVMMEYFALLKEELDDIKQQLRNMELANNSSFKEMKRDITTVDGRVSGIIEWLEALALP